MQEMADNVGDVRKHLLLNQYTDSPARYSLGAPDDARFFKVLRVCVEQCMP